MDPTAARFANLGVLLLRLVARLARATKGAFPPGPAAIALAVAVAHFDAAKNAFAVLGAAEGLGAEERARLLDVAARFRKAAGVIATQMPGPRGGASLPSLTGFSQGGSIAEFFAEVLPEGSFVAVDGAARAALDGLRRDTLVLAQDGTEGVLLLMETVIAGVSFPISEPL